MVPPIPGTWWFAGQRSNYEDGTSGRNWLRAARPSAGQIPNSSRTYQGLLRRRRLRRAGRAPIPCPERSSRRPRRRWWRGSTTDDPDAALPARGTCRWMTMLRRRVAQELAGAAWVVDLELGCAQRRTEHGGLVDALADASESHPARSICSQPTRRTPRGPCVAEASSAGRSTAARVRRPNGGRSAPPRRGSPPYHRSCVSRLRSLTRSARGARWCA